MFTSVVIVVTTPCKGNSVATLRISCRFTSETLWSSGGIPSLCLRDRPFSAASEKNKWISAASWEWSCGYWDSFPLCWAVKAGSSNWLMNPHPSYRLNIPFTLDVSSIQGITKIHRTGGPCEKSQALEVFLCIVRNGTLPAKQGHHGCAY